MQGQQTVASAWGAGLLVTALMVGMLGLLDQPPSGQALDVMLRQGSARIAEARPETQAESPLDTVVASVSAARQSVPDKAPPACG